MLVYKWKRELRTSDTGGFLLCLQNLSYWKCIVINKRTISRIHLIMCDMEYRIRVILTIFFFWNAKHVGLPQNKISIKIYIYWAISNKTGDKKQCDMQTKWLKERNAEHSITQQWLNDLSYYILNCFVFIWETKRDFSIFRLELIFFPTILLNMCSA